MFTYYEDDKLHLTVGKYTVRKDSENMTGIYIVCGWNVQLVTSKPKWSQAVKLAKLMNDAYQMGLEDGKDSGW